MRRVKNVDYKWDLFKWYKADEFKCSCCGQENMNFKLVLLLDSIREIVGFPIVINSGWRCEKLNEIVGGKRTSSHLKGDAVDIKCTDSAERLAIINTALELGINRIGIGKTFVHLDIDKTKDSCIWVY